MHRFLWIQQHRPDPAQDDRARADERRVRRREPTTCSRPPRTADGEMLKFELTVLEGEYAKRKIFGNWLVLGTTDGQKKMAERYLGVLKASSRAPSISIQATCHPTRSPNTESNGATSTACKFLVEIGIEQGKDGYEDKNVIVRAITRDMPAWGNRPPIEQPNGGGGSTGGGTPPSAADDADPEAVVGRLMRANRFAAISADRDKWTKQAFDACIAAAKDLIGNDGPIRPDIPIGRLTSNRMGLVCFDRRLDLGADPKRTGERARAGITNALATRPGSNPTRGSRARSRRSCPSSPKLAPISIGQSRSASGRRTTSSLF